MYKIYYKKLNKMFYLLALKEISFLRSMPQSLEVDKSNTECRNIEMNVEINVIIKMTIGIIFKVSRTRYMYKLF